MPILIENAGADPRYQNHPGFVVYGINSYVAVPLLRRDGSRFGVLCALDPLPSKLNPSALQVFKLLSDLISFELEAAEAREAREAVVLDLRETVKLRDQLMAIIGHDLRTPLSAITIAAAMMQMSESAAEIRELANSITLASARAARLLNTLLDFTRSRLGGGIALTRKPGNLRDLLNHVIQEVQVANPGRMITITASGELQGEWDLERLAQAFTNLLSNAVKYSPAASTVQVTASNNGAGVCITFQNAGDLIEADSPIFEPFERGERQHGVGEGLGLGLYIVRQIVNAHGGEISASASIAEGNVFRVVLPLA